MSVKIGMIFISGNRNEYIFIATSDKRGSNDTFSQSVQNVDNQHTSYTLNFHEDGREERGGWPQTLLNSNISPKTNNRFFL